jgi:hypothetical protein
MLGSSSAGALGEGGVITLDGTGNVTSGTIDMNNNGNPQSPLSVSGTYTVPDAATGRTVLNISGLQYAVYPQINGPLSVVEIDATSNVVAGRALAQSGAPFSSGSMIGDFALNLTGTNFTNNAGEHDIVGHIVPNGGSTISGTVDINANGTLASSAGLATGAGGYTVATTGRGSAKLTSTSALFPTTANFNLYVADSGDVLFLEVDSNGVLVGIAQKQF